MAQKRFASSAHGARAKKSAKRTRKTAIDFSDIPESTGGELRGARRVGRPRSANGPKQLIAIRIDPALLAKLRKLAERRSKPYQTLIHELLERATRRAA